MDEFKDEKDIMCTVFTYPCEVYSELVTLNIKFFNSENSELASYFFNSFLLKPYNLYQSIQILKMNRLAY